jgi:glucose/arabinose dehydrogenase
VALLGPHAAALGMRFYTGDMFPPEYKNTIFVARHGSWNRERKEGFDVVHVRLQERGAPLVEKFMHGWLEGENFWGRVADVQMLRDGSLLVSDDWNGAIFRVSYKR